MASEGNRVVATDDGESSLVGEDTRLLAARIAQRLRSAGLACQIVDLKPTPITVLRRDRIVVVLALTLLTALAWSYLLWLSADMAMGGKNMGDFRMIPSGMGLMVPALTPWQAMEFAFVFVMWSVMMVGMMTPSAVPMILMYARGGRQTEGAPFAATVWVASALLATLIQWALERTALLDSWMETTSNVLGGLVFVAAGTYQWTRVKDLCLAKCQKPFEFVMRHGGFRRDAPGSVMLGLR